MNPITTAIKIIDDNANQLSPLLSLDPKSSNLLIQEILNENQLPSKLNKLLKLLMNQIQNQSIQSTIYFDQLISNLLKLFPSIPKNALECTEWIKEKLTNYLETEKEFKKTEKFLLTKLNQCQEHLQIARQTVEAYEANQKSRVNDKSLILLNQKEQTIKSLHQQINQYIAKITILEKALKEKDSLIESLQRSNEQNKFDHSTNISDEKIIDNLNSDQGKLQEQILKQKQKYNKLKEEATKTINLYKEKVQKQQLTIKTNNCKIMNKLKQLHCGCFDNSENLIAIHRNLHNEIEKLKTELFEIKRNNDSKCNMNDINIQQSQYTRQNDESTQFPSRQDKYIPYSLEQNNQNLITVLECKGCTFDVNNLRKQFDNLENQIDTLQSTLVKT